MNFIEWFLILMVGLFVIGSLVIGLFILYRLRVKSNVNASIMLKAGGIQKFVINRKKSTQTKVGDCVYLFDENAVIKTKFKDFIHYMEGNPNPVIYDFKTNKPEISAGDLKVILDSDLIRKLFSLKEIKAIEILLWVILITGILSLILIVIILLKGVTLANNTSNREFLANVTRSVLKNG
jgi:hypothetical protein